MPTSEQLLIPFLAFPVRKRFEIGWMVVFSVYHTDFNHCGKTSTKPKIQIFSLYFYDLYSCFCESFSEFFQEGN